MPTQTARQKHIKKAVRLRNLLTFANKAAGIFRKKKTRTTGKEIFIDTEFGKVRALCYGFDRKETAPVYFDLHGGGFILGSADIDEAMNLAISARVGCKIISIDYAKAPEFPFPVAVDQVYAVVRHVHEAAAEYGIDRDKMVIGGHSAGGNLAAVTCLRAQKEGGIRFRGQILDYPPLDLATSPFDKPNPKGAISPKIAVMFDACYVDASEAANPYVSPVYAAPGELRGLPPALFVLPGRDSLHDEGLRYFEMLKSAGVAAECHEYPEAAHGFTYQPSSDTTDALEKMITFLKSRLQSRA